MTNDIILKPAKRLLLLYFVTLCVTLVVLGLTLEFLQQGTGMEDRVLVYIWNSVAVIGGGLFTYAALWRLASSYRLSDECVTAHTGILSRQRTRIALSRIVDYRVVRPLIERLIGLGDLYIDTAGRDSDELIMHQISLRELEKAVVALDTLLNRGQRNSEHVTRLTGS